ncbi:MAG: DUF2621 family protein [Candidatus Omnitrophota bacterium]|nr:MAG: DUF2621 family protein [Candidatus Omnitrophota bacterium]
MAEIIWNHETKEVFEKVVGNLPQFHRSIAQRLVKESAEELAKSRGGGNVEDEDLIQAFFKEVPPAFKDMMKRLFSQLDVDYSQYVKE